jgi:SAM-dependent methyltransferase
MTPPIVIQTTEMMEHRMEKQLRRRKVDAAGLYAIGGVPTAQAWKELDDKYQPPWDIAHSLIGNRYGGERCVVDLGPGSGQPSLAAIGPFLGYIREIILVDVSSSMLSIARECLQRNTRATVSCIIADFLQDANALDTALKGFPQPRLFLCLGCTAGNFNQPYALSVLRSYLKERRSSSAGFRPVSPASLRRLLEELSQYICRVDILLWSAFPCGLRC